VSENERIEKTRQAIMRFQELLDIMASNLADGRAAYQRLIAAFTSPETVGLPEKEIQRLAAIGMGADLSALSGAVLQQRFNARTLEQDFEALYEAIHSPLEEDQDAE
jgi:hypothetical protein